MRRSRELLAFVLVALLGVFPALLRSNTMVGDGVDAFGTWWFYGWIADCVGHGMDPSFTTRFFYPLGKDIFTHTGNNFVDAVVAVPFWEFGTRGFAIFIVVLLVGNALTFRPLAQMVLESEERAFAASLLWMVNPYAMFEITAGRPTQAFLWFVPAVPYFLLRAAKGGDRFDAVKLGVAAALVGWTYWFACFFMAFLCLPLAVGVVWRSAARNAVLQRWGLAAAVAVALVAPAAIPMSRSWFAGETPGGRPLEQSIFALPGAVGNSVGQRLHGLGLMELLGAPLFSNFAWAIPLCVALILRFRGRGVAWAWWAGLGLVCFLGIGPAFNNSGVARVNVAYMVLFRYLPFFNRLWFPYRFAMAGMVVAALAIASVLPVRRAVPLALALAAAGLAEQGRNAIFPFAWHSVEPPRVMSAVSDAGGVVVFMPFGIQHDAIAWMATVRMRLFGGMGESAAVLWPNGYKKRLSTGISRALRSASVDDRPLKGFGPGDAQRWAKNADNPRWLVLRRDLQAEQHARNLHTPAPSIAIERLVSVIGAAPVAVDGALVVWNLDGTVQKLADFDAPTADLARDDWTGPTPPLWASTLQDHGRFGRAGKDDWQ